MRTEMASAKAVYLRSVAQRLKEGLGWGQMLDGRRVDFNGAEGPEILGLWLLNNLGLLEGLERVVDRQCWLRRGLHWRLRNG